MDQFIKPTLQYAITDSTPGNYYQFYKNGDVYHRFTSSSGKQAEHYWTDDRFVPSALRTGE